MLLVKSGTDGQGGISILAPLLMPVRAGVLKIANGVPSRLFSVHI